MANYGRVGFYTFQPGTLDPLIDKARAELVPMTRRQPGFLRYAVVRTGADSVVSLSAWEAREQSEQAAQQLAGWVRENFGPGLLSVDNYIGEIVLSEWSADHLPAWGVVRLLKFGRVIPELARKARDELVPLVKQQPGFNTYTSFRTEDGTVITYATFDSRAQGEAAMAAVNAWTEEHALPYAREATRLEGDIMWTARKE